MTMQFVKDHAALAVLVVAFIALAYFTSGCGKLTITTQAPEGDPVKVEARYAARGCVSVDVDPKTGVISIIHKQDGTSDWITGRMLPKLGSMALVAMSGIPLIGSSIPMPGPSDVGGCVGIMAKDLETVTKPDEANAVYELVPIVEPDAP